jgi:hypothetical protein
LETTAPDPNCVEKLSSAVELNFLRAPGAFGRLVVGVMFIFLRSFWSTFIPAIAVPVSIIGTFGAMYLLGYSLDNLSPLAVTRIHAPPPEMPNDGSRANSRLTVTSGRTVCPR